MSENGVSVHVTSALRYFLVYLALVVLAAISWVLAYAHIGSGALHLVVALGIAVIKTILIAAIFMHLERGHPLNRVFAFVGIFWLAILFTLSLTDYRSRHWLPMPGNWPQGQDFQRR